jgi:gluconate kinase
MIIWLNGTFGSGKTTTAGELVPLVPGARLFDAEQVGYMLRHVLSSEPVKDFQDWTPWRGLVVQTAAQVLDYVGGTLVVVQSVLVRQYWTEIRDGLAAAGIPVRHFVLDSDHDTLVRRIEGDTPAIRKWRLDHLPDYREALSWLREEAEIVDTAGIAPADVARSIAARVREGRPEAAV